MKNVMLAVLVLCAIAGAVGNSASSSDEHSRAVETFKRNHNSDSEYTATEEDTEDYERESKYDQECEWTRDDCLECVLRHAHDIDEDGRLDAKEVSLFKKKLLGAFANWVSNTLTSLATFFSPHSWLSKYTVQEIMHRCADDDGYVTHASWSANKRRCLKHCRDWDRFMKLCTKLDYKPHEYAHKEK